MKIALYEVEEAIRTVAHLHKLLYKTETLSGEWKSSKALQESCKFDLTQIRLTFRSVNLSVRTQSHKPRASSFRNVTPSLKLFCQKTKKEVIMRYHRQGTHCSLPRPHIRPTIPRTFSRGAVCILQFFRDHFPLVFGVSRVVFDITCYPLILE